MFTAANCRCLKFKIFLRICKYKAKLKFLNALLALFVYYINNIVKFFVQNKYKNIKNDLTKNIVFLSHYIIVYSLIIRHTSANIEICIFIVKCT